MVYFIMAILARFHGNGLYTQGTCDCQCLWYQWAYAGNRADVVNRLLIWRLDFSCTDWMDLISLESAALSLIDLSDLYYKEIVVTKIVGDYNSLLNIIRGQVFQGLPR